MRSIENLGKNLTGLALVAVISMAGTQFASANTLSQVQINADDSGYAIVLNTESPVKMKKTVNSPDKMSLELKDIQASEDLSTVYNNVANIDNVTIQPVSNDGLKITFAGKDISSGKIYFENIKTLPQAEPKENSIQLSGPVNSYRPVYHKQIEEVDQTANEDVNRVLTKMNIDRSMVLSVKNILKKGLGNTNILIAFGILFIAAALMFRPKKKVQTPVQIGLSSAIRNAQNEREIEIAKGLTSVSSMQNKPAAVSNYGMKAYQNSQKNPYMTNNLSEHRSGISGIPRKSTINARKSTAPQPVSPVKASAVSTPTMKPVQKTMPQMSAIQNTPIQEAVPSLAEQHQVKAANIDSMKFLESITRIYEKNGRTDLAKGLKENLKKAQMVKV